MGEIEVAMADHSSSFRMRAMIVSVLQTVWWRFHEIRLFPISTRTRTRTRDDMVMLSVSSASAVGATQHAPVSRLYRHALESIFAFCSLKDLGSIMAVSRDWQAAVQSMAPIGSAFISARLAFKSFVAQHVALRALCMANSNSNSAAGSGSRLCRHVGQFICTHSWRHCHRLSPLALLELSQLLPQLTALRCELTEMDQSTGCAIDQLRRLRYLRLHIDDSANSSRKVAARFNRLIVALARLSMLQLHTVDLTPPCLRRESDTSSIPGYRSPAFCFSPLAAVGPADSALRSLQLILRGHTEQADDERAAVVQLSPAQLSDLRSIFWLDRIQLELGYTRRLLDPDAAAGFESQVHLPAPPVLQWKSIQAPRDDTGASDELLDSIDEPFASCLHRLPHLTELRAKLATRLPFLHSLTQLQTLHLISSMHEQLQQHDSAAAAASTAATVAPADDVERAFFIELQLCTQLTDLVLDSFPHLDSALLGVVVPAMPKLARLHLTRLPGLQSLRFLATAALAASLLQLSIYSCESCSFDQLTHVHGLRSLRVLRLTLHLDEPLPNKLRRPFTSHRANHFPNLKQVKFKAD